MVVTVLDDTCSGQGHEAANPSRIPASTKSVIRQANVSYLKDIAVSSTIEPNPTKMMLADMTPSMSMVQSLDKKGSLPTDKGKQRSQPFVGKLTDLRSTEDRMKDVLGARTTAIIHQLAELFGMRGVC